MTPKSTYRNRVSCETPFLQSSQMISRSCLKQGLLRQQVLLSFGNVYIGPQHSRYTLRVKS